MGEKVSVEGFDYEARERFRQKLWSCLRAMDVLLSQGRFESPRNLAGLEIELNLADERGMPRMRNADVLRRIASDDFQTELAQFNIEVNIKPHRLRGSVFSDLAEELSAVLRHADRRAADVDARVLMIGILPTLTESDLVESSLSHAPRYTLLNDRILAARGEHFQLDIDGVEQFHSTAESIAPEAAATSLQLHLQVTPGRFASVWNASQLLAAPQVALGANATFLAGRELWRETRPILFEQATDVRSSELIAQGMRPLTWFGEGWADGPQQLFEENVRYFPALLPICDEEDPEKAVASGDVPRLGELALHSGTVYRWNRPIYDLSASGQPHLRVENRVLPAGPTVTDTLANAAFYYGLVRALAEQPRPLWRRLPFALAEQNFHTAARYGIAARLYWPGPRRGRSPTRTDVCRLVLDTLLPLAYTGLDAWRVDPADRDRYLGVIEQRCRRRTNGAAWQAATYHTLRQRQHLDRFEALAAMTRRYATHMRAGEPVHTWPVG